MLGYLPKPYPEELLYSIVSRYRIHLKMSGLAVSKAFFGRKSKAIVDLPHCIGYFSKASFPLWGLTPEQILNQFTLLPFYLNYVNESRSDKAKKALISNNGQIVFPSLGISASTIKVPKYLKYCPECASEDYDQFGELYWRRSHQLPGVLVCTRHKIMLLDSSARYRPEGSLIFADATEVIRDSPIKTLESISDADFDKCLTLANYCENLLYQNNENNRVKDVISHYRQTAILSGFSYGQGGLSNEKLVQAFIDFYGKSLLELFGANVDDGNKNSWLIKIMRESSTGFQPIQHALLSVFLKKASEGKEGMSPFGRGPWKCPNPYAEHDEDKPIKDLSIRTRNGIRIASVKCSCGFNFSFQKVSDEDPYLPIVHSKCGLGPFWVVKVNEMKKSGMSRNAIAKDLGIDFKTVVSLLENKPNKGAAKLDHRTHSVPNTNLSDSTKEKPSKKTQKGKKNSRAICARDEKLAEIIRATASICYSESPPKHITKARLMYASNIKTSIYSKLSELPLCQKVFDEVTETLEQYRERRLRYVAERMVNENLPRSRRVLLRLASLEPRSTKPISSKLDAIVNELLMQIELPFSCELN